MITSFESMQISANIIFKNLCDAHFSLYRFLVLLHCIVKSLLCYRVWFWYVLHREQKRSLVVLFFDWDEHNLKLISVVQVFDAPSHKCTLQSGIAEWINKFKVLFSSTVTRKSTFSVVRRHSSLRSLTILEIVRVRRIQLLG